MGRCASLEAFLSGRALRNAVYLFYAQTESRFDPDKPERSIRKNAVVEIIKMEENENAMEKNSSCRLVELPYGRLYDSTSAARELSIAICYIRRRRRCWCSRHSGTSRWRGNDRCTNTWFSWNSNSIRRRQVSAHSEREGLLGQQPEEDWSEDIHVRHRSPD